MNQDITVEHPNGAVQGVCSAAIGLLALLIAFIGYTGFNSKSVNAPWQPGDLIHLGLSLVAAGLLAAVPWLATQPQAIGSSGISIERARKCFALGAGCAILAIAFFVIRDYLNNHL